ncbi:MAG: hypothetical protein WBF77_09285 [Sulfurimonadaceae bacterium]
MEKLIDETVEIARQHFKGFGFEDEQIISLLEAGRRDLTKELNKLRTLLEREPIEIDVVNLSLHALKGLLLNMGNIMAADKLVDLRQESGDARIISEIKSLLGV